MDTEIRPKLIIRFYTGQKCFGPGVAKLLTLVGELGSLRAAAGHMNMAYSKAWTVVRNCEQALGCKLLTSVSGGKHGGGAVLTTEAERLLRVYEEFCAEMDEIAQSKLKQKLDSLFSEADRT